MVGLWLYMYRKGVSAIIVSKNDAFLLVNLKSFAPQYFAILGGELERGETLEEAAYREICEEVGVSKESLELIGTCQKPLHFRFKTITLRRDETRKSI